MLKLGVAVLRLYPLKPVTARCSVRDTVLPLGGGPYESSPLLVPGGTSVFIAVDHMHRRKDIFREDADTVRPQRWATLHPGRGFAQFERGPHTCIGCKQLLLLMLLCL